MSQRRTFPRTPPQPRAPLGGRSARSTSRPAPSPRPSPSRRRAWSSRSARSGSGTRRTPGTLWTRRGRVSGRAMDAPRAAAVRAEWRRRRRQARYGREQGRVRPWWGRAGEGRGRLRRVSRRSVSHRPVSTARTLSVWQRGQRSRLNTTAPSRRSSRSHGDRAARRESGASSPRLAAWRGVGSEAPSSSDGTRSIVTASSAGHDVQRRRLRSTWNSHVARPAAARARAPRVTGGAPAAPLPSSPSSPPWARRSRMHSVAASTPPLTSPSLSRGAISCCSIDASHVSLKALRAPTPVRASMRRDSVKTASSTPF
mmetsp:Transcript_40619/g.135359  ORF Transcript_40619/g.135359 Transcript_40619/m.135359 type:complete len:313 (+) Transcript_40619:250-1188(+)